MSKAHFNHDFDLEFEQEAKCMLDACDDPECIYCQPDDADAAFWDEFMSDPEETNTAELHLHVQVLDENSGEEINFSGLNLKPYTIHRLN